MATGHEFHSETFFTTRRPSRLTCHPRATEFFQSTSVSCLMPFGDASIARSILLSCSSRPICPLISQCTACLWKNVGATQGEERSYPEKKATKKRETREQGGKRRRNDDKRRVATLPTAYNSGHERKTRQFAKKLQTTRPLGSHASCCRTSTSRILWVQLA